MPKKRTSPESSDDEPANKDSDSVFQQDENSKRAKLVSLSDTTLQDLPIELIERILIKVIVMEVMNMKLVKSERKGKEDQVIDRLRTVCSQWDSILTSPFFRNELNRTFDAQKTIRLEILHQSEHRLVVSSLTVLKDEIFIMNHMDLMGLSIYVYDYNNIGVVKNVIPLPDDLIWPLCMESSSVSNCVYILHTRTYGHFGISHITKDDDHQFNFAQLITGTWKPLTPTLSAAADGSLILSGYRKDKLPEISIYNADGSLQREMMMHSEIPEIFRVIPRPNGNLVLVSTNYLKETTLTEIDMNVTIIHQYQTSSLGAVSVFNASMFGRMMLIDRFNKIELLDSELNFLDVTGSQLTGDKYICNPNTSYFNSDRNELVAIVNDPEKDTLGYLTILRFTEE